MYEPILAIMAGTLAGWDGAGEPPRRNGSRVPGGSPRNVYRTSDNRYVAVSGTTDKQVARVLAAIGHDTSVDHARFGRAVDRLSASDELDALVAEWIGAHSRDEVMRALLDARVPVAPVNDARDILEDPHIASRGGIVTPAAGAELDAHRRDVLTDWLGAAATGTS